MTQVMKTFKHVQHIDLVDNGVESECVVIREFDNGDVAYIDLSKLDRIDLDRLTGIIYRPNAHMFPLYELMNSTILGNGENALEFFDQMVMIKTQSGEHISPRTGGRGVFGHTRLAQNKRAPGRPKGS